MISWGDVVAIAPEVDAPAVPMRAQEMILDIVSRQVDTTVWADRTDDGMVFLAAHLGLLYVRRGVAGPITAEKLGEMSASYGLLMRNNSLLASTAYGTEYERMTRLLPLAIGMVP